ncbi:MAG: hypothetical protein WCO03_01935 [bacterium]
MTQTHSRLEVVRGLYADVSNRFEAVLLAYGHNLEYDLLQILFHAADQGKGELVLRRLEDKSGSNETVKGAVIKIIRTNVLKMR